jgi:hypothetical protein
MKTQNVVCRALCAIALVFLLSGCLYSNVKLPLDRDVEETTLGTKVGKSYNHSIAWLVAWGDGGTEAAAEDGGITVIRHMDLQQTVVLFGLYSRATTIVYGD